MSLVVDDFNWFSHERKRWLTGASFRDGKMISNGAPTKPYFVPFQLLIMKVTDYAKMGSKAHFFCGLDRPLAEYARALFAKVKTDPFRRFSEWTSNPG
jgi:hypothetical protein